MNRFLPPKRLLESLQRYRNVVRRPLSQHHTPPKQPKGENPSSTTSPQTPSQPSASKKSSFPSFTFTLVSSVGALTYLAVKVLEEDPLAEKIADYPGIKEIVSPFITGVHHSGLVAPKEVPEPPVPHSDGKEGPISNSLDPVIDSLADQQQVTEVVEETITDQEHDNESQKEIEEATLNQFVEQVVAAEENENHHSVGRIEVFEEDISEGNTHSELTEAVKEVTHHEETVSHDVEQVQVREEESPRMTESVVEHHHRPPTPSHATPATTVSSGGDLLLAPTEAEQQLSSSRGSHAAVNEVLTNVSRNSIILRQELEAVLLKDIHSLDAPALRLRITQLVGELFERLSWESIRISQSVLQVEQSLTEKYEKLMAQQRKELELQIHQMLFEKSIEMNRIVEERSKAAAEQHHQELQQTIKAQAEGFQQTLTQELENQKKEIINDLVGQFNNHLANLQKQHYDQVSALLPKVEQMSGEVKAYQAVVQETKAALAHSRQTHALSSALLGLELLLTSTIHKPQVIQEKFQALQEYSQQDPLFAAIIGSIPSRVQQQGVLTLPELQVRFQVLHEEVRKVALAPENAPSIVGQFVGTVLAAISITPKGYIPGHGVEETMARAAYQLERGKLQECLHELEAVKGYSKVLLQDWETLANDRLVVDQALQALKADSLNRHRSLHK